MDGARRRHADPRELARHPLQGRRVRDGRAGDLPPGPPDAEDGAAEPPWQNPSLSELERLALLAETTATLTSSLDVDATLRHLVRLVVPLLADWVVVDLVDEEGTISRAVVVHYENGTLTHRDDLQRQLPPVTEDSPMPLSRALRGVTATLISPQSYRMPPDTGIAVAQQDLLAQTGIKSACIAPPSAASVR
ncbi:hypothetical protein GCM10020001_069240 [Nonomuraea salmonea]